MKATQKITAWTVATILGLPAFLIFADGNTPIFMVLGLMYLAIVIYAAPKIIPKWMVDYFKPSPKD